MVKGGDGQMRLRYPKQQKTAEYWVEKDQLHPDDVDLFNECRDLAFEISSKRGLKLKEVRPQRRFDDRGALGRCYMWEGRIQIAFRNKYPRNMWWTADREKEGTWYEERIDFRSALGRGNPRETRKQYKDITYSIYHLVVHEMAHLRIKGHNKRFYSFCRRLESKFIDEEVK